MTKLFSEGYLIYYISSKTIYLDTEHVAYNLLEIYLRKESLVLQIQILFDSYYQGHYGPSTLFTTPWLVKLDGKYKGQYNFFLYTYD